MIQQSKIAPSRRLGLTLLEVVLALAILAGAFATLAQLVGLGMRAASQGRDLTQAQILAESLISEINAGIMPAQPLAGMVLESNPNWTASVLVQPTLQQGMVQVTVVVEQTTGRFRGPRYELTRWIRDPSLEIPTDEEQTSESGSSSSSSPAGDAGQGAAGAGDSANGGPSDGGGPGGAGAPTGRSGPPGGERGGAPGGGGPPAGRDGARGGPRGRQPPNGQRPSAVPAPTRRGGR